MRNWFCRTASPVPPYAAPGQWFGSYNSDWHRDHPGAWRRGELEPGGFRLGPGNVDIWCSSTLDWDRDWLWARGYRLPKHHKHVEPDRDPNIIRIGSLAPGESVSIPIVFGKDASGDGEQ